MAPLLMQVLRERSRSTIIYFLFAILIIVFVFTFNTSGSGGGCSPAGVAGLELAKVDGQPIDIGMVSMGESLTPDFQRPAGFEFLPAELRMQYERPSQFSRFYYLSSFPLPLVLDTSVQRPVDSPEYQKEPNARYAFFRRDLTKLDSVKRIRVMNDLLESHLVGAEARKMGLAVSTEQLNKRFFFVPEAYRPEEDSKKVPTEDEFNQYLGRLGTSATVYQSFVENEILREKVIDVLANLVTVSDQEVDSVHSETQQEVTIEYIEVDPAKLTPITSVTDEEIAAVAKDKEALEAEYKKRESQYRQKKSVSVRALLVEAPDTNAAVKAGSPEEKAQQEALSKANDLIAKLTAKEADVPSAEDEKPAEAAAKTENPDAGAAPKVAEAKPAENSDAPAEPIAEAPAVEPKASFEDLQKKFIELVKSDSADESKANDGLYPGTMNEQYLEIRFGKAVAKAAYSLDKGQHTQPILGQRGYWILFADEVTPENIRTLEEVTPELSRTLAQIKKAEQWAPEVAKDVLARAAKTPSDDLLTIAERWNRAHQPTAPGGPEDAAPPTDDTATPETETAEAAPEEEETPEAKEEAEEPLDFDGMLHRYQLSLRRANLAVPPVWAYPQESASSGPSASSYSDEDEGWADIDGLETSAELKVALLKLSKEAPVYGKIHTLTDSKRSFILRYVETVEPSEESASKDDIRNTLLAHRQLEAYRAWYAGLLKAATDDGTVEFSDEWHQFITTAWDNEQRQMQRQRKKQTLSLGQ